MKLHQKTNLNRCKRWTLRTMIVQFETLRESRQPHSLGCHPKKRSSYSSAHTFFPDYDLRTSTISLTFLPPTCLHSSSPYLSPVTIRCHLHSDKHHEPHLGTPPRHDTSYLPAHPSGGQDQAGQLVIPQKPPTM